MNGEDFRDHHHVKHRCNTRKDRFRQGTACGNDVFVILGQRHNQCCGRFGKPVAIGVIVGEKNLGHALQRRRFGRCRIAAGACDQHGHRAKRFHRSQGFGNLIGCKLAFIHVCQKKNGHQITPASSLSFAISSATEATLTPALRPTGSTVFRTARRGVTSTP